MQEVDLYVEYKRINVGLNRGDGLATVFLLFDADKWGDRLMSYDKGDVLSAVGEIDNISIVGFVSLANCEVLE